VSVFAVNRSRTEPLDLTIELRGLLPGRILEHLTLADPDEDACNTAEHPHRVAPAPVEGTQIAGGAVHAQLPPMSWNMIRFG
jgi:alpha-N-arabinofuranosidase